MKKVFKIHEGDGALVDKAVSRLNKHADKMGYSECKVVSIGKPYETLRHVYGKRDGEVTESSYAVRVCDVEVEMPEEFLDYAAAEWKVIGRVVNAEGNAEVIAEAAYMAEVGKATEGFSWKCSACEHSLKRAFVVKNRVDGRILAVGSECLKMYTGADGHAIVSAIEFMNAVMFNEDDGEECGGGRGYSLLKVIDLEEYLAACVAIVARDGGYAKRWDDNGGRCDPFENPDCTRNNAIAQFLGVVLPKRDTFGADIPNEFMVRMFSRSGEGLYPVVKPTDADKAKAKELVAAWLASEIPVRDDGTPDAYATECKFLAERGWVTEKTAGIAASMVKGPRELKKDYSGSKYLGTVGARVDFKDLTVIMAIEREGDYGISTILKFEDVEGNVLTWFASGSKEYKKGDKVSLKATIKAHDEYKGVKGTVITRAKELV